MKHEWKKSEKALYLPKNRPEFINVPSMKFFTIEGNGNPNNDFFAEYIRVLYLLSYAVKMSPRKGLSPPGFYDFTVYPLEGVWDLSEEGRKTFNGIINKDELVFKLMIRQPEFVQEDFAIELIRKAMAEKPHPLLEKLKFEIITEGDCVQMLHNGSYDNEPQSFEKMEIFAKEMGYMRLSKIHREIYLSDARKVPAEKLKTILRFGITRL
jgi:hypothetical protein